MTLRYSQQSVSEADKAAVSAVMDSDWLTCGPKIEDFEAALCAYTGAKYAVAVSSGTAALHLAYLAAKAEKITTSPLTFVATANAALLAGAEVWFADVERDTGNLNPETPWHGVYVPVHYAGRAAAIRNGRMVVEDACHALGALDFDGCSRVGACAHSLAACFSFHPVKPITTLGEGGAVTTNDQGFADEVRSLSSHGREDGLMVRLGLNYRMTDAAAAMGIEQLKRCDEMRIKRYGLLCDYEHAFMHSDLDTHVRFPYGLDENDALHLLPVRVQLGRRDAVKAKLQAQGIGVQVHYSPIVPMQPYYQKRFNYKPWQFPESEAWAAEELSLPLHAGMTRDDVATVVNALTECFA